MTATLAPTGYELEVSPDPGSPEWLRYITASQLAEIMGLSPWGTPNSLYHRKRGTLPDKQNAAMGRGHFYEPHILDWLRGMKPRWEIRTSGMWVHGQRAWQAATPDAIANTGTDTGDSTVIVEVKTDRDYGTRNSQWGEPGSDQVPDYYGVQADWQMDTTGIRRVTFAVAGPYELMDMKPALFHLDYCPRRAAVLREAALKFMGDVEFGIEPAADYSREGDRDALRYKHPAIAPDTGVEIPDEIAVPWLAAKAAADGIEQRQAELAAFLGERHKATYRGKTLGYRKKGRAGAPPSFTTTAKLDFNSLLNTKEA